MIADCVKRVSRKPVKSKPGLPRQKSSGETLGDHSGSIARKTSSVRVADRSDTMPKRWPRIVLGRGKRSRKQTLAGCREKQSTSVLRLKRCCFDLCESRIGALPSARRTSYSNHDQNPGTWDRPHWCDVHPHSRCVAQANSKARRATGLHCVQDCQLHRNSYTLKSVSVPS